MEKSEKKEKNAAEGDKSAYRRIGGDVPPTFLYTVSIFVVALQIFLI